MNSQELKYEPTMSKVAVVATGVIGRCWIQVFIRAGCRTVVYDKDPNQVERALEWVDKDLERDCSEGYISSQEVSQRRARIVAQRNLEEALEGVGYIQESGPEQAELKKSIFSELDRIAEPDAILASSTSALDMTVVAWGLSGAHRCVVAHPLNPPHMVPVVEVVPGEKTDPKTVQRACAFLDSVGQQAVPMRFYLAGYLANRMQVALVREALNLAKSGAADIEAIDAVVRDGLGLRWALMGPFGVASTNADTGIREYYTRYQQVYIDLMDALGSTPSFDADLIEEIGRATDTMFAGKSLANVRQWRDQMIRKIVQLKRELPQP